MPSKRKMQLYIWRGIRQDYTSGIGFAVGRTKEEAINTIKNRCKGDREWEWACYASELLTTEPEVCDIPSGDWISGGG